MPPWKQILVSAVLVAAALAAWAVWVPSAAPVLARLGLPVPQSEPSEGAGGTGGGFRAGGMGAATAVTGAPAVMGLANTRVTAIGDGRALRSVAVTPLVTGRLDVLEVGSGAVVALGDVIARLDSDLEEIALERARLVVEDAEAGYGRAEQLRARGAASDVQEREARLALERARLEERDAALALERRTITAPIGGVIGLLPVEQGMQVTTSTEIATIEDRSSLLVEFRVPERVVGSIGVGDALTATPLARPDLMFEGEIVALDNRIDLDSRTLRVQAALPNEGDRLRAGMSFAIEMRLPGEPYPQVEALAIQWGGEGAFVWVARDGKAVQVPVRIVQRNAERVLVSGDLEPGEIVVSEGVQRLRDGAELSFIEDPAAPETGREGAARALPGAAAADVRDG